MAAFCCHGVFARFPELRVASIESGGDWVAPFVDHLADIHRKMPQAFDGDPVEQFKSNVYVSPFHEDDLEPAHRRRSAPTTCCSGRTTRTPRVWPSRAATSTTCRQACPTRTCSKIMGGNLARIMKVEALVGAAS